MKLHFSRRTWYTLLVLSAALSLTDALALLAHVDMTILESLAFAASGMAVLFLAAEKEPGPDGKPGKTANPQSGSYFGAFLLLLLSYVLSDWTVAARITLFWPVLAWVEKKRGMPVERQMRLLAFTEVIQIGLVLAQRRTGLGLAASILWALVCVTRGWLAITLYKSNKE